MSLQRIARATSLGERLWIGPENAVRLDANDQKIYDAAHQAMMRLAIEAPLLHGSGHPGGVLSSFTFSFEVNRRRNPSIDETMRFSAGHLSLLAFFLEWLFGRSGGDARIASPSAIMQAFRTPSGLPGHAEAGIGDIPFGAGPLGKGLSNALGVALGRTIQGKKGAVDVLLADGDSQEGQVMEAVRLASHLKLGNLVVHGDWNDIQLSDLPSRTVAADMASIVHAAGWHVVEVQKGNDIASVRAALDRVDALIGGDRPIFVCYYTTMGYGVPLMEEGSNTGKKNFHGAPLSKEEAESSLRALNLPSLDDLAAALRDFVQARKKTFEEAKKRRASSVLPFHPQGYVRMVTTEKGAARKDFGATHIANLMAADPRIVVLHADLAGSGGFDAVQKKFPDRVINVGVAEANMVMMAAGMRQAGLLPVTYTFAAFGTNEARANVRLIDINGGHVPLGVVYDCTHAGLSVGEDGETHQDRNYLNLPFDYTHVWVPADSNQAAAMAERAMECIASGTGSVFVFSGRTGHPQLLKNDQTPLYDGTYVFDERATIVAGRGDASDQATIISFGPVLHESLKAAEILFGNQRVVRVLNMASVRPLDASAVLQAAFETQHLIVAEDHNTDGGLATQIADVIAEFCVPCTLTRIGVPQYFPSGSADDLYVLAGLDGESIADRAEDVFAYRLAGGEEAIVACLYALPERLARSRFAPALSPYVERLQRDAAYVDMLRTLWRQRSMDPKKLPSTAELQKSLRTFSCGRDVNAITGLSRPLQHDQGIV